MTTGGVKDGSETHGSAANHEVTPTMRLMTLQAGHKALDAKITDLQQQPYQNQLLIQRLKKEKLHLKDAIERLKDEMVPDINA